MESDLISVLISFLVGLAAMQFYDLCPKLSRWFINRAADRLHESNANRYREEWLAHLEQCDQKLWSLRHAMGCVLASFYMKVPFANYCKAVQFYLIISLCEKFLTIRLKSRARDLNNLTKQEAEKVQLETYFDKVIEDAAMLVIFKTVRQNVFTKTLPVPEDGALDGTIAALSKRPIRLIFILFADWSEIFIENLSRAAMKFRL